VAEGASDATRGLPPWIGRPGPTAWHRLEPLTRMTIVSGVVVASTFGIGPVGTSLLVGLGVIVPATVARILWPVLRDAILLSLPLAVSVLLIDVVLDPVGGSVVAEVGPFHLTDAGIAFGAQVVLRVFAIASALVLFSRTTRPSELVASLEAHGAPARLTFVVHQALVLVPRTVERARMVGTAQRARGLDTESSPWRRARGVLALATPTVLGAIEDAETRTLALEARGFGRPWPRTLLWAPRDSGAQRFARWLIVAMVGVLVVARVAGLALP
jgi:energy-coupling factor transport system permease protein